MTVLFPYGSQVYGTADEHSDYDLYEFNGSFDLNDVVCYEAWFHSKTFQQICPQEFDYEHLKNVFGKTASNSWVKAKKKLIVESDYDLRSAQKSLFHAFRITDFAKQIFESGSIQKWNNMNHILFEVKSLEPSWSIWESTFKQRFNELCTEKRKAYECLNGHKN